MRSMTRRSRWNVAPIPAATTVDSGAILRRGFLSSRLGLQNSTPVQRGICACDATLQKFTKYLGRFFYQTLLRGGWK